MFRDGYEKGTRFDKKSTVWRGNAWWCDITLIYTLTRKTRNPEAAQGILIFPYNTESASSLALSNPRHLDSERQTQPQESVTYVLGIGAKKRLQLRGQVSWSEVQALPCGALQQLGRTFGHGEAQGLPRVWLYRPFSQKGSVNRGAANCVPNS